MKKFFDLQLFAEGTDGGVETTETLTNDTEPGKSTEPERTYTESEVNEIIKRKKAEFKKQQEKQVSEAERYAKMSEAEKTAERMKALEEKIHGYEVAAARSEMSKQARAVLSGEGITVADTLIENLIAEDAETTKANVESFAKAFKSAVEKGIKEAVKGETPRAGGKPAGMTKDDIMKLPPLERQKAMAQHIDLFR